MIHVLLQSFWISILFNHRGCIVKLRLVKGLVDPMKKKYKKGDM